MEKYTLESYERYRAVKCRPLEISAIMDGAGRSAFQTVCLEPGQALPAFTEKTLLKVRIPSTGLTFAAETESALRSLAAQVYQHPLALGVTLSSDAPAVSMRRLWEAAAQAFSPKRYYVPVTDGEQLDWALKRGFLGGVLAVIGDNAYDTCEAFAMQNAQQLYKRFPVLIRNEGKAENASQFAAQWHAMAVENIPGALAGWRIALRRLTYPRELTAGGFAPMRFWWNNRGPSYCHEAMEVRLRLEKDGQYTPIPLHDRFHSFHLADRVYNEIVRLPKAAPGLYHLEYGLFTEEGEALALCHEGRTADGYYPAGDMRLDDRPRPEYEHIWDDYFADGYYPLFDPKVPGT